VIHAFVILKGIVEPEKRIFETVFVRVPFLFSIITAHHMNEHINIPLIRCAAFSGALCVVFGAFGAHALKESLAPEQLQVFETGVRYQFYHTFAILACGLLAGHFNTGVAGKLFMAGIIGFSGSLYLLSTRTLTGLESWTWLGPVTPLGGLCFILGWIFLFINAGKSRQQ
jgi:uncharacterized membrane protein YgdD (TMEM256/DUF423 family)